MHTPTMTHVDNLGSLVTIEDDATVSRTVLTADGVRIVLFAFDAGQVLTEHTAAMPVLLQVLDGRLRVGGGPETVELTPGGVVHLDTRLPHSVEAIEPSRMALIMLNNRAKPTRDGVGIGSARPVVSRLPG